MNLTHDMFYGIQVFTHRRMSAANPRIGARWGGALLTLLLVALCGCTSTVSTTASPSGSDGRVLTSDLNNPYNSGNFSGLLTRDLRVVSYNIRWPNPDDGLDRWDLRRHRVAQTLDRLRPDVFGAQECFAFQAEYLAAELPGYAMVGVGRDDGGQRGEMTAIFVRTQRLILQDQGHLWLSDTPDVPGSVGWDAALTRMATWVVVVDRSNSNTWLIVNTHFDHRGRAARTESAKLLGRFIREKLAELGPDTAAVLMGDFNSAVDSAPYLALCAALDGPRLTDTYRAVRRPCDGGSAGTFNGFRNRTSDARIDWLLVSPGVTTLEAGIDRRRIDGRNPSDHDPVWAVLRRE